MASSQVRQEEVGGALFEPTFIPSAQNPQDIRRLTSLAGLNGASPKVEVECEVPLSQQRIWHPRSGPRAVTGAFAAQLPLRVPEDSAREFLERR